MSHLDRGRGLDVRSTGTQARSEPPAERVCPACVCCARCWRRRWSERPAGRNGVPNGTCRRNGGSGPRRPPIRTRCSAKGCSSSNSPRSSDENSQEVRRALPELRRTHPWRRETLNIARPGTSSAPRPDDPRWSTTARDCFSFAGRVPRPAADRPPRLATTFVPFPIGSAISRTAPNLARSRLRSVPRLPPPICMEAFVEVRGSHEPYGKGPVIISIDPGPPREFSPECQESRKP